MTSSFQFLRDFFNAAQLHPQKIAVVLDDQCWTYAELVEKIQCVASHLHNTDVIQGQLIYQIVERGFPMICGLLGIICIGGVYCPINPTDPVDRMAILFEQIQGQYILLHEKTRDRVLSATIFNMLFHWIYFYLLHHILKIWTIFQFVVGMVPYLLSAHLVQLVDQKLLFTLIKVFRQALILMLNGMLVCSLLKTKSFRLSTALGSYIW